MARVEQVIKAAAPEADRARTNARTAVYEYTAQLEEDVGTTMAQQGSLDKQAFKNLNLRIEKAMAVALANKVSHRTADSILLGCSTCIAVVCTWDASRGTAPVTQTQHTYASSPRTFLCDHAAHDLEVRAAYEHANVCHSRMKA